MPPSCSRWPSSLSMCMRRADGRGTGAHGLFCNYVRQILWDDLLQLLVCHSVGDDDDLAFEAKAPQN